MELSDIIGYVLAVLVGISLGLMGSGGSILTVPILVYVFGISPVLATAYSLFIVGITALTGTIRNILHKEIDFKKVLVFGIPSIISVFLTRLLLVPEIPEKLFSVGSFEVTKSVAIMVLFAFVMIFSAISMLKSGQNDNRKPSSHSKFSYPTFLILGIFIGIVAGLVGAGGGFLIIPALVILGKTPMKTAMATSLCIVAIQSLVGFSGDLQITENIDWKLIVVFSAASVFGIFIGLALSKQVPSTKLKKGFGWFVLSVALYIIVKEFIFQ